MAFVDMLPSINASMNGIALVCLAMGGLSILRGNRDAHRRFMLGALGASAIFLVGYLTRIALAGTHRFPEVGATKTFYLVLLASHSVLAAINLPLILRAVFLAWKGRFDEHKRVVRYAWPIWLYVSATGVLVYWMLYHLAPRLTA